MSAGKIIVLGDTGPLTGENMSGGEIIVFGKIGPQIGGSNTFPMQGGIIRIKGTYCELPHPEAVVGGKIFHKRKLIMKDGKALI